MDGNSSKAKIKKAGTLDYKQTVFVGFAFFLICAFWQAYDSLIPKILTDKFGMKQGISGVIMALDNILALFMLPLFGAISDKYNSKRGRRTPFIIWGTVIAAVAFVFLSLADSMQLKDLDKVTIENPTALETLYDADLTIKTPDGETVNICDTFTREEFTGFTMYEEGSNEVRVEYTNYVVPARQVYAWNVTKTNPVNLVFFMVLLMVCLISMSIFRSPAVALMPDVTIKPLRSKANAIINLMGTAGGIIILILGIVLGTGKTANALMGYGLFFAIVSGIMIISLIIFLLKVNEPALVKKMEKESRELGIADEDEDTDEKNSDETQDESGTKHLSGPEFKSLLLILASVVLWFMGYNAVISKYSVYAGKVLNVDFNTTLLIAQGAAIISYLPVGVISSKFGRKKTILGGIVMLAVAFCTASFLRAGSSVVVMNVLFALAGIGWAYINVNSFPMVVELSKSGDVGKYTGFYYTASMAAQTVTPILSGVLMDIKFTTLFPYATVFVVLAFVTMCLVKHGDSIPGKKKDILENFDIDD
ncbi:MAG: MFS transporter [Lachnospiraceae bacterium]|nr:MFS transporter [Lachnospiraceae bacterium]